MLVQNLAITYKCYSSIGNSLDLKEMIEEVLKTFVNESYAVYATYIINNNNKLEELANFGRITNFEVENYTNYENDITRIVEDDKIIVILKLNYGSIFLVSNNVNIDCNFFISMFESFLPKLNLSIEQCLNLQKKEELNLSLEKQKKELELVSKAKDDFLANMSHELKTPLNSINVVSSVMKKNTQSNLTEKEIQSLEVINKCGNELLFLVNDILDLSKLEAGEISLNCQNLNMKEFIQKIYETILPQAKEKKLNFIIDVENTIHEVYTDKNRLGQIIKNLLSNSLKFTKEGTINLNVKNKDKNIVISVKDDGIGIAEEKLEHIFNRFKQAEDTTTKHYGGTGLGLSICIELALLLKGHIRVNSIKNEGSCFELEIPKDLRDINLEDKKNKSEDTIINNYDNLVKKEDIIKKDNLLIFNNDPVFFFKVIMELNKKYNVTQLSNYDKFINNINTSNFAKIILDMSNLNETQISRITKIKLDNMIIISNKTIEDKFKEECLLTINKDEVKNNINKI